MRAVASVTGAILLGLLLYACSGTYRAIIGDYADDNPWVDSVRPTSGVSGETVTFEAVICNPLEGVERLLRLTAQIQKTFPHLPCVGTGYSWLRHFFPHVGAAAVERGEVSLIGLGRSSFAYPEAPRDLMEMGFLNPKKVCVACSCCSELTRAGLPSGCVVRNREPYAREYTSYFVQRGRG